MPGDETGQVISAIYILEYVVLRMSSIDETHKNDIIIP